MKDAGGAKRAGLSGGLNEWFHQCGAVSQGGPPKEQERSAPLSRERPAAEGEFLPQIQPYRYYMNIMNTEDESI